MDSRIRKALQLYAFSVLGIFLLVAPWSPVWFQAASLLPRGLREGWVVSGWFRGLVSALGALDLVVAFQMVLEMWREVRG